MTYHIALAGKGSSGKSTLVPHLVNHFLSASSRVLVVDADPNGTASFLVGAPTGALLVVWFRAEKLISLFKKAWARMFDHSPTGGEEMAR